MGYTGIIGMSLLAIVPLAAVFGCQRTDTPAEAKDTKDNPMGNADPTQQQTVETEYPANHLADQTSLYLLMHAHNPVDWYPWGEEALAKAKAEGKLIFLSVGYSSCYWCHVMERESFMDEEIAALLNEHFVCIKVDREERPDIDQIYMTALQIYFQLTRSPQGGGWPMTMFLTPEAQPVMGGTYFPPRDRRGLPGLVGVLDMVRQRWQENPKQMRESGKVLAAMVKRQLQQQPEPTAEQLSATLADATFRGLVARFDPEHGGFGYSAVNSRLPKFPEPSNLLFLLDRAARDRATRDGARDHKTSAESMLIATLERMAAGGIVDHVGGGFHRYSTDRFWAIPHFEKMLYDNGQLATVYAEAYRLTGQSAFRHVTEALLDFVLREMTGPEGGFYAAIDAETDAEEGRYYVWDHAELAEHLTAGELALLKDVYDVEENGNFEGHVVLLLRQPLEETSSSRKLTGDQLREQLAPIHEKLLALREKRKRPLTDTKVLTAWNGLMIRGFADAGRILENPRYTAAAVKAATFVLENLRTEDGRLLRTFAGGRAQLNAYLDDYAFLADGLIALYRATDDRRWLDEADRLTAMQIERFWDDRYGGFFFTSSDHEQLIARSKDPVDSALPSGNAVTVGNLVYLAAVLEKPEYLDRAEKTLAAFAAQFEQTPSGMPRMALSLAAFLDARGR
ncbi:MAG: thioredoxin domain-containing protein [Thermoguttaceae bacterium]